MAKEIDGATMDTRRVWDGKRRQIELYNADGKGVPLYHVGAGRSAFLCLSGPSLAGVDLSRLTSRGLVTMGVNNSPATFALQGARMPNYWTCVDYPGSFIEQIWKDATMLKITPLAYLGNRIKTRNPEGELVDSAFKVEECPNVLFYERNSRFNAREWLPERSFNWGNASEVKDEMGNKGSRSVMLVALKLLYYMGFKRVYLLGADFKMEEGVQNYAFEQERSTSLVRSNNSTYTILNSRFKALLPHFETAGFEVFNTTLDSGLSAFPSMLLDTAISAASHEVTAKPVVTKGHYAN